MITDDLTLIIKTFERPESLKRLIASIRLYYPLLRIVIADDSRNPIPVNCPNLEYCILPFATGTSFGRNYAVSKVKTKYFFTLDDDFVFTPETSLLLRYDILENTDIDLVGSNVKDKQDRKGQLIKIQNGKLYRWVGCKGSSFGHPLHDYVPQCFMARTQRFIEAGGWDSDFLVWDHLTLFVRLLNKLKITMLPVVDILHKQDSNQTYQSYRWGERVRHDTKLLYTKYGITECEPLQPPPGWRQ